MQVTINAGELCLNMRKGADRLESLIEFASRENEKRGYLFVSRVLGKHIPVRPSRMRATYDELASLCGKGPDTYVVGMAETATGLGAGVADSLSRITGTGRVFYQHTTRHELSRPLWLTVEERHSHAVEHLLYQPDADLAHAIGGARRLLLVDDEITTGSTLGQLANALLERLPNIEELVFVSIVSWLDELRQTQLSNEMADVRFVNLMEGQFDYERAPGFRPTLPMNTEKGTCTDPCREDLGRCGIEMPYRGALVVPSSETLGEATVVGIGEHLYLPFLIAESWEADGVDVLFQSTTRSPILPGDAIKRKLEFQDIGKSVVNFIYNLPIDRKVIVVCENDEARAKNGLIAKLEGDGFCVG